MAATSSGQQVFSFTSEVTVGSYVNSTASIQTLLLTNGVPSSVGSSSYYENWTVTGSSQQGINVSIVKGNLYGKAAESSYGVEYWTAINSYALEPTQGLYPYVNASETPKLFNASINVSRSTIVYNNISLSVTALKATNGYWKSSYSNEVAFYNLSIEFNATTGIPYHVSSQYKYIMRPTGTVQVSYVNYTMTLSSTNIPDHNGGSGALWIPIQYVLFGSSFVITVGAGLTYYDPKRKKVQ